ncbi:chymotrypsin-1-like [Aphidius gifuensis]|uniref:chymotrypsin-1-like n=1 Tax=Aphidius gifuensis TaxID=684658 RepID=UPI001CDB7FEC|nr:chymotrypsin-1-like [Aphidius gifuensis]
MLKTLYLFASIAICTSKLPGKLIGGRTAEIEEFPYLVSLQHAAHHVCSCTIISHFHVMTSASCVILNTSPLVIPANLKILTGTNDRFGETDGSIYYNVKLVIFHPFYDEKFFWINDIAILKLENRIEYSMKRKNILLPSNDFDLSRSVFIAGWGYSTSTSYACSRFLQVLQMIIKSQSNCGIIYHGYPIFFDVQNCATALDSLAGVSQGDGGSPLIEDGKIVGVTSVYNAFLKNSIIYTRVFFYKDWILSIINNY